MFFFNVNNVLQSQNDQNDIIVSMSHKKSISEDSGALTALVDQTYLLFDYGTLLIFKKNIVSIYCGIVSFYLTVYIALNGITI